MKKGKFSKMADDGVEELQESLSKFVSVAFVSVAFGARIKALLILPKAHYIFPAVHRDTKYPPHLGSCSEMR